MKPLHEPAKALQNLLNSPVKRRLSRAARIVAENRGSIRRAMRRGHSLDELARALAIPKSTLKRQLHLAGLFFRKPSKKRGVVVRPYKRRKSAQ